MPYMEIGIRVLGGGPAQREFQGLGQSAQQIGGSQGGASASAQQQAQASAQRQQSTNTRRSQRTEEAHQERMRRLRVMTQGQEQLASERLGKQQLTTERERLRLKQDQLRTTQQENRVAGVPSEAQYLRMLARRGGIVGPTLGEAEAYQRRMDRMLGAAGGGGGRGRRNPLIDLITTTRLGFGPGGITFHPLIGRMIDVVTKNPELLPLAVGAGALYAGFEAFQAGQQRNFSMAQAVAASGGTAAQVAGGGMFGMGPQDVAAQGARLRQLQSSNTFAILAGGYQPPPMFGSQNFAALLQRDLEMLRRMGPGERQLWAARQLELEQYLPLINASREIWQRRQDQIELEKGIYDKDTLQRASDFQAQLHLTGQAFGDLGGAFAKFFAPGATETLGQVQSVVGGATQIVNAIATFRDNIGLNPAKPQWVKDVENVPDFVMRWLTTPLDRPTPWRTGDDLKDSQDRLTDSIRDLTGALPAGIYGTAPRAETALPQPYWVGPAVADQMQTRAIRLGAF